MFDWIGDFFKSLFDLIPKLIYLLYASLACLLDIFQMVVRKLAGLDVYYDANGVMVSGDIVTNFIAGMLGININGGEAHFDYSPLSTVFWSMVLFGIILIFVSVFVAIIKSHYNYDEKAAKGPMQYVYAGLKALVNIFAVPTIVVLGLFVSQAILTALDNITSNSSASITDFNTNYLESANTSRGLASGNDEKTYIYYDIFGVGARIRYGKSSAVHEWPQWDSKETALIGASTTTFSGALFRTAAYNGNRVRTGHITKDNSVNNSIYGFENDGIFGETVNGLTDQAWQDKAANMIDTAFANHFHLSASYLNKHPVVAYESGGANEWTSRSYFTNWLNYGIATFSKFNVGAVWYYYDLWSFNFIVGFGACAVCVTLFINIILGLITRIFMCVGLFLLAPPLFGLSPFDEGKAAKGWRENFVKQALMAYGAIIGMNIFFVILPLMNQIYFFNIGIADLLMQTLIIIVGLVSIKAFISVVSGLVGGEDANKAGESIKEDVAKTIGTGVKMTAGAALMPHTLVRKGFALKNSVQAKYNNRRASRQGQRAERFERANRATDDLLRRGMNGEFNSAADIENQLTASGMAEDQARAQAANMWNSIQNSDSIEQAQAAYARTDENYRENRDQASRRRDLQRQAQRAVVFRRERVRVHNRWADARGFGAGPLSFIGTMFKSDEKGFKALHDQFWKPPDYARQTAENTAAMNDRMRVMDTTLTGVESGVQNMNLNSTVNSRRTRRAMEQGFSDQLAETQSMHTDMNTGFTNEINATNAVNTSVNEGFATSNANTDKIAKRVGTMNTHLRKIKSDTQKIAADTNTAHTQLRQINEDMAKAERDRAEAQSKREDIEREIQKARKKLNEIERNTRH